MIKRLLFAAAFLLGIECMAQSWKSILVSNSTGEKLQLAEGRTQEVYLAYRDFQTGKANVKKNKNGIWTWVGDSTFSPQGIAGLKLTIAGDSMPVVAFQDVNKNYQLTVMKFNGTKWDTLGNRGFSGFTSAGEIGLACGGNKIFAAYQQYNQIKVWVWNTTNKVWDYVGSNGIASTGFPSGCDLKIIGSEIFLGYRTNPGNNEVRKTTISDASPVSIWYTVKGTFSSGQSGALRISDVIGMPMASNIGSSDKYLYSYIYGAGKWNTAGMPPHKINTFDICDGLADTFPYLSYISDDNKGRVFRANALYQWDSLGSSSKFSNDVLKGNVEVLYTSDKRIIVAYERNSDWKFEVREFCASVNGVTIAHNGPVSFCAGTSKVLSVTRPGLKVQWYLNNNILIGQTGTSIFPNVGGSYTAKIKNLCNDSSSTAPVVIDIHSNPVPTIVQNGAVLETQTFLAYEWYKDGNKLGGETNRTYTPSLGGVFTVKVLSAQICMGTSVSYTFWPASINRTNVQNMSIYPNPVVNELNVQVNKPSKISIYSLAGKLIYTHEIVAFETISMVNWPAGCYIVKDGNNQTQKIVKQ